MKAILSCTDNPLYSFFIPLAIYSWKKIGVDVVCFIPEKLSDQMNLACEVGKTISFTTQYPTLNIAPDREVTYFQCARLFGACLDIPDDEDIITSDIDMAVFGITLKMPFHYGFAVHGTDLVNPGQLPMCYIKAQAKYWRKAFNISKSRENFLLNGPEAYLEEMLGYIQCENMRGNYWAKDQEEAFKKITNSGIPVVNLPRSNGHNQFAMRRMDRDGWNNVNRLDIIDAHLPRPGYELENFNKIKDLFHAIYPDDDLTWMVEYHEKYLSLL